MSFESHEQWEHFYNAVKGPDWPECPGEDDYIFLPDWVKEELISFGYDPGNSGIKKFNTGGNIGIDVFYQDDWNGGGTWIGQEFVPIIKELYPNRIFEHAYEWCSGCGFIAYSLVDHGVAKRICMSDIAWPALELAERTARYTPNKCKDITKIYLMKDLSLLPADHMFDLVVASPPTFPDYQMNVNHRIYTDLNWNARRHFFKHIKDHLTPDGVILMHESYKASTPDTFKQMIEDSGLEIKRTIKSKQYFTIEMQIYFLEVGHK